MGPSEVLVFRLIPKTGEISFDLLCILLPQYTLLFWGGSAWSSYCSQALHVPCWWYNVRLSGQAIVHSTAAHKVLTLSPAIWHCLTKDTNIPN